VEQTADWLMVTSNRLEQTADWLMVTSNRLEQTADWLMVTSYSVTKSLLVNRGDVWCENQYIVTY